jgi:hypothetical protein
MTLKEIQQQALGKLMALSPGTFVWGNRTVSVYKSPSIRKGMNLTEYSMQLSLDDFYVIADIDDVADWDVEELRRARVTVDGETYQIGQNVQIMAGGLKIWLKAVV